MNIGYLSEFDKDYSLELKRCKTIDDLFAFTTKWREYAPDAYLAVWREDFTLTNFEEFQKGLRKESRGKYAGDEWAAKYGMVVLPELMLRVMLVAGNFKVPFGCAFIRLQVQGFIIQKDNAYYWSEPLPED
jgi:hypothetical protein